MRLIVSQRVFQKLKEKHKVSISEVEECFSNQTRTFLEDTRTDHLTNPPTMWFIAPTDKERLLKVVFIEHPGTVYELKTAYDPNREEERIYDKYAQPL
jgi:uncharacterized DUF497 family protein